MKLNLFLLSCLFAFLAGHIVNYSVIFLSLELFDSPILAGLGFGLCFLPPLVLGWFAGIYCDRYSPRKVILIAQNSYLISLALLYLAVSPNALLSLGLDSKGINIQWVNITLILSAAFFSGVGWSFVAPARFASLPFYVTPQKLVSASIALNLVVMTGFGLAPLVLKYFQVNWGWTCVIFAAIGFTVISTLLLLPLGYDFERQRGNKAKTELVESFAYVKKSAPLKQLLALAAITYLLMGPMQVLLPSVAKDILLLPDLAQGQYLSLVALALILGGVAVMFVNNKLPYGQFLFVSIALAGLGIGLLGAINNWVTSALILLTASILGGMAISLIVAGIQYYAPDKLRGRIMSMYTIISQVVPALSGIVSGVLASGLSVASGLFLIGGVIVLITLLAYCTFTLTRTTRQLVSRH